MWMIISHHEVGKVLIKALLRLGITISRNFIAVYEYFKTV